jgi:nucleotide-binding universal stress UspA family protein
MLLGSVSGHLSRHASCPVVVVREQADPQARRVVVGVDGSPGSEKAIGFAFDAASRDGAALAAVHAWHYPWADLRMPSRSMEEIAEDIQAREEWLHKVLAGWTEKYPDVGATCEAIPDHPARVLVNASEHASLVVVGSRGRGGFPDLRLGSVSRAVLHRAHCPVAIVR